MPANLTPQYLKAEQAFREAKTPGDRIAALEEMLRVIPKHKGTDHLQADLRRKLARMRDEATQETKSKKKTFDPFRVERHGAGQVLVLGGPNSGKSSLVAKLTNAPTQPAPYPFSTTVPVPGMLRFEDVSIQLVDLPPIAGEVPSGMLGLARSADGALLLADLAAPELLDHLEAILKGFEEGRVRLFDRGHPRAPEPLVHDLPCLLLANKIDAPGAEEILPLLEESLRGRLRLVPISAERGDGLEELGRRIFEMLELVRIYSKLPGKPPEMDSPFALRRGATVTELAAAIHRDFPEHLREARVWGSARFEGQAVGRDYVLADKDVVELHVDLS
jgi:ribosome-interacting GTPase 1